MFQVKNIKTILVDNRFIKTILKGPLMIVDFV